MYKAIFAFSLCSVSSLSFAGLPKDSDSLGNYANSINSSNSNNYRPFQVMANQQTTTVAAPLRSSGFTTKYLGVRYSNKEAQEQNKDPQQQASNQVQNDAIPAYKAQSYLTAQIQPNIVRPTIRPASYNYSQTQHTSNYDQIVSGRVATINCVAYAARAEGVPLYVLLGIHSKERGNNGQTATNKNASLDMGQFQINTIHFNKGGMFENYNKHHVNNDGCLNARLAAKILKDRLNTSTSKDFWTRAAAYHSWTPYYNNIYKNGTNKQPGLITYSNQWKNWLQKQGVNPN